jgi:hypothetical protein
MGETIRAWNICGHDSRFLLASTSNQGEGGERRRDCNVVNPGKELQQQLAAPTDLRTFGTHPINPSIYNCSPYAYAITLALPSPAALAYVYLSTCPVS